MTAPTVHLTYHLSPTTYFVVKILVVDVGGTNIKALATGRRTPIKIPSGPRLTPRRMVRAIREATTHWRYDVVSIGYPGPVVRGRVIPAMRAAKPCVREISVVPR